MSGRPAPTPMTPSPRCIELVERDFDEAEANAANG